MTDWRVRYAGRLVEGGQVDASGAFVRALKVEAVTETKAVLTYNEQCGRTDDADDVYEVQRVTYAGGSLGYISAGSRVRRVGLRYCLVEVGAPGRSLRASQEVCDV